ncbi:MAG: TrbC/VirB2 family protein [Erythrobacter sp.]|nr:TrbC/VirB2 family protein [Erythrobacter sp.]
MAIEISRQASLIEPDGAVTVASSLDWINGVLLGSLAVGVCVLAVALVGAMMLTGRLPLREGLRVVIGCFVLLGAPVIAAGFMWAGEDASEPPPPPPVTSEESPRGDLPPASYDPYSGA